MTAKMMSIWSTEGKIYPIAMLFSSLWFVIRMCFQTSELLVFVP